MTSCLDEDEEKLVFISATRVLPKGGIHINSSHYKQSEAHDGLREILYGSGVPEQDLERAIEAGSYDQVTWTIEES